MHPYEQEDHDAWFSRADRFDGYDRGDLGRDDDRNAEYAEEEFANVRMRAREHIYRHGAGFPRPERTAPNDRRYVGLYYYSAYFRHWDYVVDIDDTFWYVRAVNDDGTLGELRRHCSPLHAGRFAHQPFEVR